ncbi:MAG: hypothetical protein P8Z41_10125 [Anaerolineales bacterium]
MTLDIAIRYLIVWSAVGAFAFCIYVFAVFRGGLVYTALANYYGLARSGLTIPFMVLFLLNFVHYIILFLFDTLVIDGLVIGVWRPEFLRLPDDMGAESMKKHMLKSIPVGIVAGVALTVISTAISYFAMFAG